MQSGSQVGQLPADYLLFIVNKGFNRRLRRDLKGLRTHCGYIITEKIHNFGYRQSAQGVILFSSGSSIVTSNPRAEDQKRLFVNRILAGLKDTVTANVYH